MKDLTGNTDLLRPIQDLHLSPRLNKCLGYENIEFIGQLIARTHLELIKAPNVGILSLKEIKLKLAMMSLSLGMKTEEVANADDWRTEAGLRKIFQISSSEPVPTTQLFQPFLPPKQIALFGRPPKNGQMSLDL